MKALKVLAINIRDLRKTAGLTQDQLADRANTHQTIISGIESCRTRPSFKQIESIAKALKVEETRLFMDISLLGPNEALQTLQAFVDSHLKK